MQWSGLVFSYDDLTGELSVLLNNWRTLYWKPSFSGLVKKLISLILVGYQVCSPLNGTWSYFQKKILWINMFHYLPHIHDRTSSEILPHSSHEKGFSPVCTLWCLIRLICMEKLFITLITCEWILPSVYSLIIYKSSSFRINLFTLFTWKWFLSSMYSLLSYKTISYGKNSYHIDHMWMASPQCVLSGIRINLILRVNLFSQSLQWKGLFQYGLFDVGIDLIVCWYFIHRYCIENASLQYGDSGV